MVDGLKFYHIPKGYLLYRGDTYMPSSKELSQGPCFFGLSEASVEEYGMVYAFKTMADVEVLALDDKLTMETLYKNAQKPIRKILEKNYGYHNNIRDSYNTADKQLSQYLCDKGYSGYALLEQMGTDFEGQFHTEIMLCEPNDIVKVHKQITDEKMRLNYIDNDKARKASETVRKKRAKKRRQKEENRTNNSSRSSSPNRLVYGSPSSRSLSPNKTVKKLKFGSPQPSPTKSSYNTHPKTPQYIGGKKSRRSTKRFRKTLRKIETK